MDKIHHKITTAGYYFRNSGFLVEFIGFFTISLLLVFMYLYLPKLVIYA